MTQQQAYVRSNRPFEQADITLGALLNDAVRDAPDHVALTTMPGPGSSSLTYSELQARATAVAHGLLTRFEPGDRIVIWSGSRLEWTITQFAAALAGLVLVAVNPGAARGELRYVLEQSGARGIVLERTFKDRDQLALLSEISDDLTDLHHVLEIDDPALASAAQTSPLPEVLPSDAALIQYTSGTTGRPKGALLTHRGLVNSTKSSEQVFGMDRGSVWLNTVPMYTTSGSVFVTMMSIWNRGTQLMMSGFDPDAVCRAVSDHKAAFVPVVPTMALAVLEAAKRSNYDFSPLKVIVIGGSAIAPDLIDRLDTEIGGEVFVVFGQTESCSTLCLTEAGDTMAHKTQTVGYPIAGTEIRIADPKTGTTLKTGEIGEICARGPSVMSGYFRMPEQTDEAIDADGWLHTGDLGSLDPDGYPRITGRLKEMIIRGGSNIYPREIEEVLNQVDGVAEVAVFGVPDDHYGEVAVAAVRCHEGRSFKAEELLEAVTDSLARYKVPSDVWFLDAFPMTPSGKIQKFELRNMYTSRVADDQPQA